MQIIILIILIGLTSIVTFIIGFGIGYDTAKIDHEETIKTNKRNVKRGKIYPMVKDITGTNSINITSI